MKKLQHYLISLLSHGCGVHCYLMTNDKDATLQAAHHLLAVAEDHDIPVPVPMILSTPLGKSGIEKVQGVIRGGPHGAEAEKLWQEATDFHMSVFILADSPEHDAIKAIH